MLAFQKGTCRMENASEYHSTQWPSTSGQRDRNGGVKDCTSEDTGDDTD